MTTLPLRAALVVAIATSASIAACANNAPMASGTDSAVRLTTAQPVRLSPGQVARLPDGSRLRYELVVNDSRCKPGVQCVWAGDAELRFSWLRSNAPTQVFSLHTQLQPRTQVLGANTLHIEDVARGEAPAATVRLD